MHSQKGNDIQCHSQKTLSRLPCTEIGLHGDGQGNHRVVELALHLEPVDGHIHPKGGAHIFLVHHLLNGAVAIGAVPVQQQGLVSHLQGMGGIVGVDDGGDVPVPGKMLQYVQNHQLIFEVQI